MDKKSGKIIEYKDGIALCNGLYDCGYNEMVEASAMVRGKAQKYLGLALDLKKNSTGVVIFEGLENIKVGDTITSSGQPLGIYTDESVLGNVIDPLGNFLYEPNKKAGTGEFMPLEKVAPGVFDRKNVTRPLQTGNIAVDLMIPVGRGQRQLVIGDAKVGKTAFCIDTILAQKKSSATSKNDVICIYCCIGQKSNKVTYLKSILEEHALMEKSIIVVAGAADPASLQYIAPFAATAVAEYFAQKGKDVFVVYDDLTKHANAYREISLLLKRFPGREAFPGDVFYLHSRLLERSLQYSDELGGGSITSFPIIETLEGDVSSYISTNVISITDGQIYLDTDLFNLGVLPAINVATSVSRVGSFAQIPALKKLAPRLKLELSQFAELKSFAQFGSELDEDTRKKIERGNLITEILKQEQFSPLKVDYMTVLIYAIINGYFEGISTQKLQSAKKYFLSHLQKSPRTVFEKILNGAKIEGDFGKEVVGLMKKCNLDLFR